MSQQQTPYDNANVKASINSGENDPKASKYAPYVPLKKRKRVSKKKPIGKTRKVNRESILFVWLDLQFQSTPAFIHSLRTINDRVKVYSDESTCLDALKSLQERIFFISSSSNQELIAKLNSIDSIEAIFVPDSDVTFIKGEYNKLLGFFPDLLGLLPILKEKLGRFQKIMLEKFLFEQDDLFLWLQTWKDELTSEEITETNRKRFLKIARAYYRSNSSRMSLINEFEQRYSPKDALRWCVLSPFPSCIIRHAFLTCQTEQLNLYRFLIADASQLIRARSKFTRGIQLYRGMKLTRNLVDTFVKNTGKTVCASGFFTSIKSRAIALDMALSPEYRSDLSPVLFKIHCNSSADFTEIPEDNRTSSFVFDIAANFRIIFINRGKMTVVKMRTLCNDDDRISRELKINHRRETIQTLYDELLAAAKPLLTPSLKPLSAASSKPLSAQFIKPPASAVSKLLQSSTTPQPSHRPDELQTPLFVKPHSSRLSRHQLDHLPEQSTSLPFKSPKPRARRLSNSPATSVEKLTSLTSANELRRPSTAPLVSNSPISPQPPVTTRLFHPFKQPKPQNSLRRTYPRYSKPYPQNISRRILPKLPKPRSPTNSQPLPRPSSTPLLPPLNQVPIPPTKVEELPLVPKRKPLPTLQRQTLPTAKTQPSSSRKSKLPKIPIPHLAHAVELPSSPTSKIEQPPEPESQLPTASDSQLFNSKLEETLTSKEESPPEIKSIPNSKQETEPVSSSQLSSETEVVLTLATQVPATLQSIITSATDASKNQSSTKQTSTKKAQQTAAVNVKPTPVSKTEPTATASLQPVPPSEKQPQSQLEVKESFAATQPAPTVKEEFLISKKPQKPAASKLKSKPASKSRPNPVTSSHLPSDSDMKESLTSEQPVAPESKSTVSSSSASNPIAKEQPQQSPAAPLKSVQISETEPTPTSSTQLDRTSDLEIGQDSAMALSSNSEHALLSVESSSLIKSKKTTTSKIKKTPASKKPAERTSSSQEPSDTERKQHVASEPQIALDLETQRHTSQQEKPNPATKLQAVPTKKSQRLPLKNEKRVPATEHLPSTTSSLKPAAISEEQLTPSLQQQTALASIEETPDEATPTRRNSDSDQPPCSDSRTKELPASKPDEVAALELQQPTTLQPPRSTKKQKSLAAKAKSTPAAEPSPPTNISISIATAVVKSPDSKLSGTPVIKSQQPSLTKSQKNPVSRKQPIRAAHPLQTPTPSSEPDIPTQQPPIHIPVPKRRLSSIAERPAESEVEQSVLPIPEEPLDTTQPKAPVRSKGKVIPASKQRPNQTTSPQISSNTAAKTPIVSEPQVASVVEIQPPASSSPEIQLQSEAKESLAADTLLTPSVAEKSLTVKKPQKPAASKNKTKPTSKQRPNPVLSSHQPSDMELKESLTPTAKVAAVLEDQSSTPLESLPPNSLGLETAADTNNETPITLALSVPVTSKTQPAPSRKGEPRQPKKSQKLPTSKAQPTPRSILQPPLSPKTLSDCGSKVEDPLRSLNETENSNFKLADVLLAAENHLKNNEIDLAIAAYRRIKPESATVLFQLGCLYANKKMDHDNALTCFTKALELQEKTGENAADTLTQLGLLHNEYSQFDLGLEYHTRAIKLYESTEPLPQASIATNLIGISNAYRDRGELSIALDYAQQALSIHQSLVPTDESCVATDLAVLANIHYDLGDTSKALELDREAYEIFKTILPPDSPELAAVLNNLAVIEISLGELTEAREYLEQSLKIFQENLPANHPSITKLGSNIQRVIQIQQREEDESQEEM